MGEHLDEAEQAYEDGYAAGLAEARAQIKAGLHWLEKTVAELDEARAQIAAKDAALREGSSQWLLDAVANWKKRAEVAEALVTEVEHMRESLAWYAKREADLLARAERAEAQIAAKDAALVDALVILAQRNIPPDIQELLVSGDPMRGIAPGALEAALSAPARETE